MPDGPEKSIWGAEQKKWLMESLLASDADWKVLVSPTPIVGPDRPNKRDNHANVTFAHEGNEFRRFAQENLSENFFLACGDRHWQYHSVHPETGVQEFSCGPASDEHAGGSPGENPDYHKFHRVKGGFLSVKAARVEDTSRITFNLHAVDGSVVYSYSRSRPAH
jgi:alkaline phosphatase D